MADRGIFFRSPDFKLILDKNGQPYFVYRTGKKVLTDPIGISIWKALPNKLEGVVSFFGQSQIASARLIADYLRVLVHAGIVIIEGIDQKGRENEAEVFIERNSKNSDFSSINNLFKEKMLREEAADKENSDARQSLFRNQKDSGELVSVIVVTYNGEDYIRRCLQSIFYQNYRPIEVIVIDNASRDATVDLVKQDFPDCRLIILKKNRHYAAALNRGLEVAEGNYFLLLNQDIELAPDCISALLSKMKTTPRAGIVSPMMKFASLPGFINGLGNHISNRNWGSDNFINCVDVGQFRDLAELPSACFGAVFISREALREVGGLDEGYGSFYEDVDWSFRCWYQGWRIVPAPEAVVYHEFGGSYPEGRKLIFVVKNRLRLILKLFHGRVRLGFLKNYIIEDILNCIYFLRNKNFRSLACYGVAYLWLCFQLPSILWKRMKVMKKKIKGMTEREVLAKNPPFDPKLREPMISVAIVRRYYRWCLSSK